MKLQTTYNQSLLWLLENDPANPGVRYFALRDMQGLPEGDPQVKAARQMVMASGPVPEILNSQNPDGSWIPRGGKYQSTTWQIVFLAELGADPQDERVRAGCEFVLDHYLASNQAFAYLRPPVPSGVVHCMNGLLVSALNRLGYSVNPRVQAAAEWQAGAILGELPPKQYFKSGTSGPEFACGVNLGKPCGWGATKAMKALVAIPESRRTPLVQRAIQAGAEFLLRYDLATANFPYTERISSTWFKLGFPLSYWSDILETVSVLIELGYGGDPRLEEVLCLIQSKQDTQGRWKLENTLNGKTWVDIEVKGKPSKWVTLRALRVLKCLE